MRMPHIVTVLASNPRYLLTTTDLCRDYRFASCSYDPGTSTQLAATYVWKAVVLTEDQETNRHLMQKCVLATIGLSISWSFEDEDYKYRHKLLQHVTRIIDSLNRVEICTFVATCIALPPMMLRNAKAPGAIAQVNIKLLHLYNFLMFSADENQLANRLYAYWNEVSFMLFIFPIMVYSGNSSTSRYLRRIIFEDSSALSAQTIAWLAWLSLKNLRPEARGS
ncbi:hypothetical protein C8J57DRAFT_1223209 [Mycena rebaudengoi]|nr:hypothetical protein C8J57DRAFT_1223209 [Mycena rebaudengoi]